MAQTLDVAGTGTVGMAGNRAPFGPLKIPYLMMTRHDIGPGDAFGGWLMPVVPPMASAANGVLLIPHVAPGQGRLTLLPAPYAAGAAVFTLLYGVPTWGSR